MVRFVHTYMYRYVYVCMYMYVLHTYMYTYVSHPHDIYIISQTTNFFGTLVTVLYMMNSNMYWYWIVDDV